MSAFCVTRPRPFSLSRERSPISKQMPRHDGLGHASLLGVLGDRLAFLHNDGEQQVDVLKWHGGPQCPEGLHKARAASLSSSLNDDFSILDRALQHFVPSPVVSSNRAQLRSLW